MLGKLVLLSLLLALVAAGEAGAATLPADTTAILSGDASLLAPLPAPVGDSTAAKQSLSQDGRLVAFVSTSDGLTTDDDDHVENVYVEDRATGAVTLASRRTGAGPGAGANCEEPAISDDGKRVAFTCAGPLDDADTNQKADVYVRDLVTGETILVSRATGLGAVGDADSFTPSLSQDGNVVAFASDAENLGGPGRTTVYVRDLASRATTPVSRPDGDVVTTANNTSDTPSISDDGDRVAFRSAASNLVPGDTNGADDVFVRTRSTNRTVLASRADGALADPGNGGSIDPAISGDGTAVAFSSNASNLDPADRDFDRDVYRRSLTNAETTLIDATGGAKADRGADQPAIDDSGTVVAFSSEAGNLDSAATGVVSAVYASRNGTLSLVSRADGPAGDAASSARESSVSGDGGRVLFEVGGSLSGERISGVESLAVRDLDAGTTATVTLGGVNLGGDAHDPSASADGRFVAFVATAPAFGTPADLERGVVVRNLETGATVLASRADGVDGAPMSGFFFLPSISADGRRVAFEERPGTGSDRVWVRDIASGTTTLVSRADGPGGAPANGFAGDPKIDAAGDRVAFISTATNLGDGDTDASRDVHVRDLEHGTTVVADRANGAAGAKANNSVEDLGFSADGSHVGFATAATNLADGDTDGFEDVHVRDLGTGKTVLVSAGTPNLKDTGNSRDPSLNADGTRVAFDSSARQTADGATGQVFVRDLPSATTTIASRADGRDGAPSGGEAIGPVLSADGHVVAFLAFDAASLLPGLPAGQTQLFRRDLEAGTTRLVSRGPGPDGRAATGPPQLGALTADGACVQFTAAGDLVGSAPGSADFQQVYERTFGANCPGPPVPASDDQSGGDGGVGAGGAAGDGSAGGSAPTVAEDRTAPRLSAARLSRTRFRVAAATTPLVAAAGRGTVLGLTASEPARLTVTVERQRFGQRRRSRCRVVAKRARTHRCTAFSRDGTLSRSLTSGPARIAFTGKVGSKRLAAGRHRLRLVARDAAGNASRPVTLRFTVVR